MEAKGISMVKDLRLESQLGSEDAAAFDLIKGQLLIVLVKRLGGNVVLPVSEVDDTGSDLLTMEIDENKNFILKAEKKQ